MGGVRWLCLGGSLLLFPVPGWAQGEAPAAGATPDEKVPKRWIRFLPVGEAPPYRYEYRGGVRYELPPDPGSTPPREVVLRAGDAELGSTFLALGAISEPLAIPEGEGPIPVYQKKSGADSEPWHSLRPREAGHVLAILWRDWRQGSWDKAMRLILPDDPAAFRSGSVRLVNVSPFPATIRLAGKEIKLAPGKHVIRPGGNPGGVELRVLVGDRSGNSMPIYSSGLVQNRGERVNVVIFRADGEKPRRPAKVIVDRELARLPPVPAKTQEGGGRP